MDEVAGTGTGIRLGRIPDEVYPDYRREVIFEAYKWDPHVGDSNTIARHAVLMDLATARQLERWAEQLSAETMLMEESLAGKLHLVKRLGLPTGTRRALEMLPGYRRDRNVRLMRFDFHPTRRGWALSEVNSDVPGGLAETSALPSIASRHFKGYAPRKSAAAALLCAFKKKAGPSGTIAFVHATSYSDDRQEMQYLGDYFESSGYRAQYAAPDQIKWAGGKAVGVDGIVRFFPFEWMVNLPKKSGWEHYFGSETPSCNHPIALFTQSKRLPLVWDKLGVDVPAWRRLLPETADPRSGAVQGRMAGKTQGTAQGGEHGKTQGKAPGGEHGKAQGTAQGGEHGKSQGEEHGTAQDGEQGTALGTAQDGEQGNWIFKPALGRVGEGISISGAVPAKEIRLIEKAARRQPMNWVAQRMFSSLPLAAPNGDQYHLCVGVFTVDGESAGFYGRISARPRIDESAEDIAVLVGEGEG